MKQKSKKRSAKKAAPKLRTLMIRLDEGHNVMLENVMKVEHQKTAAGAIKIILENYLHIGAELIKIREQLQVEKYNCNLYKSAIERYTGAREALTKVKPVTKLQREIFDELEEEL